MTADTATDALHDRLVIEDVLYRYGSCIDRGDGPGLRAVLADDVHARYGNREPIVGADALVQWIDGSTRGCLWQHHFLSVYHDVLRRGPDGWRIARLLLEILWAERRTDPTGYLATVGGRGPAMP